MLVAISIPIFTSQLEKSREATDMANIRSAYAEVTADYLLDDTKDYSKDVKIVSNPKDWKSDSTAELNGKTYNTLISQASKAGDTITVTCKAGVVKVGNEDVTTNATSATPSAE